MSTQSPTPPTPKGQRNNNRRNQKRVTTPHTQRVSLVTTPPSSPPRNASPGSVPADSVNSTNINLSLSKKKGARSAKKVREDQHGAGGYTNGHRHTSSNPNVGAPVQMRDSPHYAGPTFHASPAPSALPIPSFLSKSVPDSELATMLETDSDCLDPDADLETTPSKSKSQSRQSHRDEERKPTPLDFLFKAAVEARHTQRHSSSDNEARLPSVSTRADPTSPSARRADSVAGGLFPLEMDSPGRATSSTIGPSFATPYKDRMNALRSASSPSPVVEPSDEAERRAKTAALKDLLLNPRPQRPSSSPFASSPFGKPNGAGAPLRTSSGPATPASYGSPSHGQGRSPFESEKQQSYFAPAQASRSPPPPLHGHGHGPRRDMTPLHPSVASETPRRPMPGAHYGPPPPPPPPPHFTSRSGMQPYAESPLRQHSPYSQSVPTGVSTPSKPVDTKQMEDDLRRILKLGVTAGVDANGVQSSFA